MSSLGRIIGGASVVTGVLGAAVVGGVAAQRALVRRHRAVDSEALAHGFDALRADRSYSVAAADGVALHVEEVGDLDAPLTVVFGHGWTLRLGAWHFQRVAGAEAQAGQGVLADGPRFRMVFYDQRSHGRSSRAGDGHLGMADLADDLAAVLATAAPTGPVVIVGHSMGGMALLTLAARDPAYFAARVAGVGLLSTTMTALTGLPLAGLAANTAMLRALTTVTARYPALIERGRSSTKDAVWLLTRTFGFARTDVSSALVDYLDAMISGTPVEVMTEFLPALLSLDQVAAMPSLAGIPTLILTGDADRVTPLARSRALAAALPAAELVVVAGAGHMVTMEAPEVVNAALGRLLRRAAEHAKAGVGRRRARR